MSVRTIAALFALSVPSVVFAHPGHGTTGALHYLLEVEHLLPLGLVFVAAVAGVVRFVGRRREEG